MKLLINDFTAIFHGFLMLFVMDFDNNYVYCFFEEEWNLAFFYIGFFVVIQNIALLIPYMAEGRCILNVIVKSITSRDFTIILRAYQEKWLLLIPLWIFVWNSIFWIIILYIIITY